MRAEQQRGGEVFLAYSRREFYFAESLAARLRTEGIDVWFDVERLQPAADWATEIDAALRRAVAVVLVASRASLASTYVEREWRVAQEIGISVHVVVAEAVRLPEDLRPEALYDLRTRFKRGSSALAAVLRAERPAPRARLRRGVHTPLALVLFALSLLAVTVAALVEGALFAWGIASHDPDAALRRAMDDQSTVLPLLVVWVAQVTLPLWVWWSFLERRFRALPTLLFGMSVGTAGLFLLFQVQDLYEDLQPRSPDFLADRLAPVFGIVATLSWAAVIAVFVSESFRRWLPTGETIDWSVLSAPTQQQETAPPAAGTARRFRVHHDGPADADVAADLGERLRERGHLPAELNVDADLVVVSDDTRRSWLEELLNGLRGTVVCVFATGVQPPADVPALERRQWADYRSRSPATLDALAAFLAAPGSRSRSERLRVLPERIDLGLTPRGVLVLFSAMVLVAGPAIGAGAGALFVSHETIPPPVPVLSGAAEVTLIAGLALLLIALALTRRRLTRGQFLVAFGIVFLVLLTIGGTPMVVYWSAYDSAETDRLVSLGTLAAGFAAGVGPAWHWLPTGRAHRRRGTLAAPRHARTWLVFVGLAALFWAGVVQDWSP